MVEFEALRLVHRRKEDAVAHDVARAEVRLLQRIDVDEIALQLRVERPRAFLVDEHPVEIGVEKRKLLLDLADLALVLRMVRKALDEFAQHLHENRRVFGVLRAEAQVPVLLKDLLEREAKRLRHVADGGLAQELPLLFDERPGKFVKAREKALGRGDVVVGIVRIRPFDLENADQILELVRGKALQALFAANDALERVGDAKRVVALQELPAGVCAREGGDVDVVVEGLLHPVLQDRVLGVHDVDVVLDVVSHDRSVAHEGEELLEGEDGRKERSAGLLGFVHLHHRVRNVAEHLGDLALGLQK